MEKKRRTALIVALCCLGLIGVGYGLYYGLDDDVDNVIYITLEAELDNPSSKISLSNNLSSLEIKYENNTCIIEGNTLKTLTINCLDTGENRYGVSITSISLSADLETYISIDEDALSPVFDTVEVSNNKSQKQWFSSSDIANQIEWIPTKIINSIEAFKTFKESLTNPKITIGIDYDTMIN